MNNPTESIGNRWETCVTSNVLRSYRYRLYPTGDQKVLLEKHFGCTRWAYNYVLGEKTTRYAETGVSVSVYELDAHFTQLKERPETTWLSEVSASSLQSALRDLDRAYTKFFKGICKFPRFKCRHDPKSFRVNQGMRVDFEDWLVHIPKFQKGIRATISRPFVGKIKTVTVTCVPTGKYYASILVEMPETEPTPPVAEESKALGLDFGLKDLVVTSDGRRFENPKALKANLRRLKIRQRRLSRKVKGSKNRDKARLQVALVHEKISNVRNDNLHKVSSHLVRENQATTLCIEDLSVTDMVGGSSKSRTLNRSIQDAGWRELRRQLEYKCRWYGKNLRVIGRFEPSSKLCSNCGQINHGLKLSDREWTCASCGMSHDRDVNAAQNIKRFAFCEQNTSSEPLASSNYRQVSRKVTPVDQPDRAETKQEYNHSSQSIV